MILSLLVKEFLEIRRTKKLLILTIIFLFIAISSPILAKILPLVLKNIQTPGLIINIPDPTWKDAIDQLVKNLSQIAMVVILFTFGGVVSEEKSKKTLEIILTKPISRKSFILAKFLASLFFLILTFFISAFIFYLYSLSLFGSFNIVNFLWLSIHILVFLSFVAALTIFYSSLTSNQIVAVASAFITEILVVSILPYIDAIKDYLPGQVTHFYKIIMEDGNSFEAIKSSITTFVIIILLIIVSSFFFNKYEVER